MAYSLYTVNLNIDVIMEKIKVFIWILLHLPLYSYKYWQTRHIRRKLQILNSEETIREIMLSSCSVSRYGDGELQIISHYLRHGSTDDFHVDTFQQYNTVLAKRLLDVYRSKVPNHLKCLPYAFKDASISNIYGRLFWEREWLGRYRMLQTLSLEPTFGDASFTRFYMGRRDIKNYSAYVELLKKIWDNRELLIVEGEHTRLGIGNNLFDNASSIQRILCPSINAFESYEQILAAVEEREAKEKLILIALGHTATVLAYDLSLSGYQAIDIGHVDIEYEWYLMKAKGKVPVPNKYVNEVIVGRECADCNNDLYHAQIIKIIK